MGEKLRKILFSHLKFVINDLGAKNVHFEEVGLREDDLSGSIQDVIAHGRGFKSVEISGVEVCKYIYRKNGMHYVNNNFLTWFLGSGNRGENASHL